MKLSLLKFGILVTVVALSQNLWAGTERFNSEEFNAIIKGNLQAEKELREQLRVNAGVPDLKKEMNPDFAEAGRQIVGVVEAENVAAPTTVEFPAAKKERIQKKLFQRNLKRVSAEIDSSENE
jgi:hypothetical protein